MILYLIKIPVDKRANDSSDLELYVLKTEYLICMQKSTVNTKKLRICTNGVTVHSAPEHHAVQVRMNVMWVLAAPFCEAKLYMGLRSYCLQGNL